MTLPRSDKLKTQPRARAVFLRIDTSGGRPLLETKACNELVLTYLLNYRSQQIIDLIGFVFLPREIQMVIVPREITISALVSKLEVETGTMICQIMKCDEPAWDAEYYSEQLDGNEDVKARLNQIHMAPVRQKLASNPASYDYSSANPRYVNDLNKFER